MTLQRTNIADIVRDMTPDECEVFDLILNGYDPSNPQDVGEFVSRIDAPVTDLILGLLEKRLLQKVPARGGVSLQANPATVWFLAAPEDRTYVPRKSQPD